eukprot:gene4419-4842_t
MSDCSSSEDEETWNSRGFEPLRNAIAFGWTEAGRCGFEGSTAPSLQLCPRAIPAIRLAQPERKGLKFVYKSVAAGARHTAFLMINAGDPEVSDSLSRYRFDKRTRKSILVLKRQKKVLVTGLNQMGLCEELGHAQPTEVPIENLSESLSSVAANNGSTYIVTKSGNVLSFGNNKFGKLGYDLSASEEEEEREGKGLVSLLPRRIIALERKVVLKVATVSHHVLALTKSNEVYSWGKNDKGQLGRGFESPFEVLPAPITFPVGPRKYSVISLSCGQEHSIVLLRITTIARRKSSLQPIGKSVPSSREFVAGSKTMAQSQASGPFIDEEEGQPYHETFVYGFGDSSRGQLGPGDESTRAQPQENFWVTRLLRKLKIRLKEVVCGGFFVMGLVESSGQVIAWGANDYGQLGLGHQYDTAEPTLLQSLQKVYLLSAGIRHCAAAAESSHSLADLYTWGFNGWGELGLGDTCVRLYPTKVSAMKNSRIRALSCGDRHTVLLTSHKPMLAGEVPALRPFFQMIQEETPKYREKLLRKLKRRLQRESFLDPEILNDASAILPDQAGSHINDIRNDMFEKGLRYCLDTFCDEFDWRRLAMETCFRVVVSSQLTLQSVCLTCARRCVHMYRLTPYVRNRNKNIPGTTRCDCYLTGNCQCRWSKIREVFDRVAQREEDGCINQTQLRTVLKLLRDPFPVEAADVDDAMITFSHQRLSKQRPRLHNRIRNPFRKHVLEASRSTVNVAEYEKESDYKSDDADDIRLPGSSNLAGDELLRVDPISFEKWYRQYYDEPDRLSGEHQIL